MTYSLAARPFVEHLTLIGANPINATGNSTFNVIIGNSADNVIDGGSSSDVLAGGLGNDSYFVDSFDLVMEKADEGIDTVFSSASSFSLPLNLENLTLIGTTDSHGLGNDADNVITGNSGNNVLVGLGGIDTLIGGLGNDHYVVDSTTDVIIENPGGGSFDRVQSSVSYSVANLPNIEMVLLFGNGSDAIDATGNSGDNVLQGDAAANVLAGGAGDDSYQLVGPEDAIVELSGGGTDTVFTQFTYTLGAELEKLTLTGNSGINGTGNALDNVLTGNSAANVLAGGAGNDTYVLNAPAGTDTIIENPGEGTDTVQANFTFSIASLPNLENLTLTGSFPTNATGNASNNVLTGNSSSNVLNGADGIDTLIGGSGNDTYVVDNVGDEVVEFLFAGTDTIQVPFSYTLGANVENLVLTGTSNIDGKGNELSNTITGNSGDNYSTEAPSSTPWWVVPETTLTSWILQATR